MKRHAHFNLFVANHGYHEASWKVSPNGAKGALGLDHFIEIAQLCERGAIDSLFFADAPGVSEFRTWFMAQAGYDPIDLLAALADLAQDAIMAGSVADWMATGERMIARARTLFTEIRRVDAHDLTTLTVALRQLRNLALLA